MVRKKIFILPIIFFPAIIISVLIFFWEINSGKKLNAEQLAMRAAIAEYAYKETKEKDVREVPAAEEHMEEKDKEEQKPYTNIDTSNDYVNFERLIMQISEYTTPDEMDEAGDQQ